MDGLLLFEGGRSAAEEYLRSIAGNFYVYLLCRPDGRPFYIGKGVNRRALAHEAEARRNHPIGETNPFKCNVIRKILREGGQVLYRIDTIYELTNQQGCLEREAVLIKKYGRLHEGGPLTNLAGGLGNLSGAAPHSLARHADTLSGEPTDNPERAVLNCFLLGIGPVESVPVKPIRQISRILQTTPHPQARSPTPRCAYALIASASASGQQLSPGVQLPRAFSYQGVEAIIENGVARDITKAGMADLIASEDPRREAFQLSAGQIGIISKLVGEASLAERGLI